MKIKRGDFVKIFVCLATAFLLFAVLTPVCSAVEIDDANSELSRAERDLGLVYNEVAAAAASGANVTEMLHRLDVAGAFLSDVYTAIEQGDYEKAQLKAASCEAALTGLSEQAKSLKAEAVVANYNQLWITVILSISGVVLIIILGFLGWRFLERWYFRRSDMKSERVRLSES